MRVYILIVTHDSFQAMCLSRLLRCSSDETMEIDHLCRGPGMIPKLPHNGDKSKLRSRERRASRHVFQEKIVSILEATAKWEMF